MDLQHLPTESSRDTDRLHLLYFTAEGDFECNANGAAGAAHVFSSVQCTAITKRVVPNLVEVLPLSMPYGWSY